MQPFVREESFIPKSLDPHLSIEPKHLQASIAVYSLNLLTAAVDRKVVQFFWLDTIQIVEYIGFNATKARAIGIDAAFAGVMVKVNAPTILPDEAEVKV